MKIKLLSKGKIKKIIRNLHSTDIGFKEIGQILNSEELQAVIINDNEIIEKLSSLSPDALKVVFHNANPDLSKAIFINMLNSGRCQADVFFDNYDFMNFDEIVANSQFEELCHNVLGGEQSARLWKLNPEFCKKILLGMLKDENAYQQNKMMQYVLQNYKRCPEIVESKEFTSLIKVDTFKYIKDILFDYCKWVDDNKRMVEANQAKDYDVLRTQMSKDIRRAIIGLEADVEFFYSEKGLSYLYGRARGLNINVADAEHVKANLEREEQSTETISPTIEQLMLVRVTEAFPTNNTIVTSTNSDYCTTQNARVIYPDSYEMAIYRDLFGDERIPSIATDYGDISPLTDKEYELVKEKYAIKHKGVRNTLHFALNAAVGEHKNGNAWDSMPFVIMEPYAPHHGEFCNLSVVDAYKYEDMKLTSPIIFMDDNVLKKLLEMAKTNKGILETLKNSEIHLNPLNDQVTKKQHMQSVLLDKGLPAFTIMGSAFTGLGKDRVGSLKAMEFMDAVEGICERYGMDFYQHDDTIQGVEGKCREQCSILCSNARFAKQLMERCAKKYPDHADKYSELIKEIDKKWGFAADFMEALNINLKYVNSQKHMKPSEKSAKLLSVISVLNERQDNYIIDIEKIASKEMENFSIQEIQEIIEQFNKDFQASVTKKVGERSVLIRGNEVDIEKIKRYRQKIDLQRDENLELKQNSI